MNGKKVANEACSDMAGLKVMLRMAESDPDFDYDEFFRAYAASWRCKMPAATEKSFLRINEHPSGYLRTNVTLAQFDKFQETYNIKKGDGMYVAPEDRISVW